VMHQSPQLLLSKGKSVYDVSHSDIDAEDWRESIVYLAEKIPQIRKLLFVGFAVYYLKVH
jgi:hypothetical protein